MKINVKITNSVDAIVYNEDLEASNDYDGIAMALVGMLKKDVILDDGDCIKITTYTEDEK